MTVPYSTLTAGTASSTLTPSITLPGVVTAAAAAGGFTEMQDQAGFVIFDQAGRSLG